MVDLDNGQHLNFCIMYAIIPWKRYTNFCICFLSNWYGINGHDIWPNGGVIT